MILLLTASDKSTRNNIIKPNDRAELEMIEVYTANKGNNELVTTRTGSPDFVLTDISMSMNVVEMETENHQAYPNCSRLDDTGKPLDLDKLNTTSIEEVMHMNKVSETEPFVCTLIQSSLDGNEVYKLWKQYNLPHDEGLLLYTMLYKQKYSINMTDWIRKAAETVGLSVIIGLWNSFYLIHVIVHSDQGWALEEFQKKLIDNSSAGRRAILAIGEPVDHYLRLRESFVSAQSAYMRHFYHPECQLLIGHGQSIPFDIGYNLSRELEHLLIDHPDEAQRIIKEQFEQLRYFDGTPIVLVQNWAFQIKTKLSVLKTDLDTEGFENTDNSIEYWQKITSMTSLDQIIEYLLDDIGNMTQPMSKTENLPIVLKVQQYIKLHYMNPLLTLEEISDYVNLSLTYLCKIFKSSTGQTINSYLTDYRIYNAKVLLRTTHMRVNDVAKASGFSSSNYFIKVFKKSTGLTPQEYKKRYS